MSKQSIYFLLTNELDRLKTTMDGFDEYLDSIDIASLNTLLLEIKEVIEGTPDDAQHTAEKMSSPAIKSKRTISSVPTIGRARHSNTDRHID